ncbi:GNAT family N-acetyltransferase [bacterium]|nr:GNAT family N-acetyltransferase [bacterium]
MSSSLHQISVEELAERLGKDTKLAVLDASWHMPASGRDALQEFNAAHIPGAQFLDIDELADQTTPLPHMLPSPGAFAQGMAELGITPEHEVVVYDSAGLFSAARAWWMLKAFGHRQVRVLAGGLPAWRAARQMVAGDYVNPAKTDYPVPSPARLVCDLHGLQRQMLDGRQVVDARSSARFAGREVEPREHMRQGHIPGSFHVHYASLLDPICKQLLPPDKLRSLFEAAGVNLAKPIATTCGSGVTAAVLCLALAEIGHEDWVLYDGSWAEWGQAEMLTPVEHDIGRMTGIHIPTLVTGEVTYTILEMSMPPDKAMPVAPTGDMELMYAEDIPLSYYRYLYHRIGRPWHWSSRLRMDDTELTDYLHHPMHEAHVLYHKGAPAGYFELNLRNPEEARIPYVGLLPDHMGRGLGKYLIYTAVNLAWKHAPERVMVNVSSLDHPRALLLLQQAGFTVSRQERKLATLYRD